MQVALFGSFDGSFKHLEASKLFCVIGGSCFPTERSCFPTESSPASIYGCKVFSDTPGKAKNFPSIDGHTPVSEMRRFEFRRRWIQPECIFNCVPDP